jgi:predicted nucleic-acid-binding Zn-ribbon protein
MPGKRMFHCPRCRHTEEESVPHRLRCPKCGASIPRPERQKIVRPGTGSDPRGSHQQFFH